MKRVLVTGAGGFIGRQTLKPLIDYGFDVVAIRRSKDAQDISGVRTVQLDLCDDDAVDGTLNDLQATHLLHLAWAPVVSGLWTAPENVEWVRVSLNFAEAFAKSGGKHVIGVGSCGEYDWSGGLCVEDITALKPSTLYGACKHGLHTVMEAMLQNYGVGTAWGRIFFVYGPGEHPSRLGASVAQALLNGKIAECTHGQQLRDYAHVADVANGLAALANSELSGAYNIASGRAIRVKDLILALGEAAGRPDLIKLGAREAPAYEPPLIVSDMSKTFSALDWRPKFSLELGAKDVINNMH
ncbi:MAG: NAD(P)-dependent oxidoreductase [Pseudomonadota bacterium]